MDEFIAYKIMEFVIFSMYLLFIFLAIQIWFIWKDLDKSELNKEIFLNELFFKKNCMYLFSFSIFFIIHKLLQGSYIDNSMLYFEFLDMMAFICIVMLAYDWYSALRTSAHKKSLPLELTNYSR